MGVRGSKGVTGDWPILYDVCNGVDEDPLSLGQVEDDAVVLDADQIFVYRPPQTRLLYSAVERLRSIGRRGSRRCREATAACEDGVSPFSETRTGRNRVCLNVAGRDSRVEVAGGGAGASKCRG